ncbi:hypothetical protein PTE_03048 [Photorhabdus khanii NC19]|uniref:Uncharacterized protein n=1 Tax=Photorhabdus khanii NC19 TaxID=1004151 RepID=W3V593_9GAMM|nr:hypothetical protein PTE_03048 [Photorhabdus khanii NC19]
MCLIFKLIYFKKFFRREIGFGGDWGRGGSKKALKGGLVIVRYLSYQRYRGSIFELPKN